MAIIWTKRRCSGEPPASRQQPGSAAPRARAAAPLSGLAAAVLVAGGWPALAAPQCVREAERAAFDVRALQSQLMVVALVCERHDDYNAFVQRHQRGLHGAYLEMTAHFRRLHGALDGEQLRDAYITELANAQSQAGTRQGASFCRNMEPLVRQALAVRDTGEVARLSTTANVASHPYALAACAPSPASAAAPPPAAAPPALGVPAGREREERERDDRDEEIVRLQNKLDQIERMLERRSGRKAPMRAAAKSER